MAVDRELRIFCLCVCSFVISWRHPLGALRRPFSVLGFDFGFFLDALGQPLDHFVTPWSMEVALVCQGTFCNFDKLDVQFRANGSQVRSLRVKRDLAEFSRLSGVRAQSDARAAAPNPTSLAPGARMT